MKIGAITKLILIFWVILINSANYYIFNDSIKIVRGFIVVLTILVVFTHYWFNNQFFSSGFEIRLKCFESFILLVALSLLVEINTLDIDILYHFEVGWFCVSIINSFYSKLPWTTVNLLRFFKLISVTNYIIRWVGFLFYERKFHFLRLKIWLICLLTIIILNCIVNKKLTFKDFIIIMSITSYIFGFYSSLVKMILLASFILFFMVKKFFLLTLRLWKFFKGFCLGSYSCNSSSRFENFSICFAAGDSHPIRERVARGYQPPTPPFEGCCNLPSRVSVTIANSVRNRINYLEGQANAHSFIMYKIKVNCPPVLGCPYFNIKDVSWITMMKAKHDHIVHNKQIAICRQEANELRFWLETVLG